MKKIIVLVFLCTLNICGADKKDLNLTEILTNPKLPFLLCAHKKASNHSSDRFRDIPSDVRLEILKYSKHPIKLYKTMRILCKQSRVACSNDDFIRRMIADISSREDIFPYTISRDPIFLALRIATPETEQYLLQKIAQASDEEKHEHQRVLHFAIANSLRRGDCVGLHLEYHPRNKKALYKRQLAVASSALNKNVYKNIVIRCVLDRDIESLSRIAMQYVGKKCNVMTPYGIMEKYRERIPDQYYEKKFGKPDDFLNQLLYCTIRNLFKELSKSARPIWLIGEPDAFFRDRDKIRPLCKMTNYLKLLGARPTKHHMGLLRNLFFNDNDGNYYDQVYWEPNDSANLIELDMPHLDDEAKFEM